MLRSVVFLVSLLLTYSAAVAEVRIALVITNASYPAEIGKLENPHKDAAMIAPALESVEFEKRNITILKDVDQPTMRLAIADFIERIEKAGSDAVAFFYYSGHGAADRTDRGENYLIPIGTKITLARQLPILGVSLSEITRSLERVPAKARFVVIDACRNVAFTKGLKDPAKGFVPERKLDGMIVAFATRPGETAEDNNIYASALASILPTPGLRAEEVFKETQLKVADLSKGLQIPWTEDGLLTKFKFKEASPEAEVESAFWIVTKVDGTLRALEAYLQRYPDGPHSREAKLSIEQIRQEDAFRAASQKKAEEEPPARRQKEERIAAEQRAHEVAEPTRVANIPTPATPSLDHQPVKADPSVRTRAVQTELKRVGCDSGAIDGNWGPKVKDALAQFARHAKIELKSDYPTEDLLQQLSGRKEPVCPPLPRAQPQKDKEVVRSRKREAAPRQSESVSKGTAAGSSCWSKCAARGISAGNRCSLICQH